MTNYDIDERISFDKKDRIFSAFASDLAGKIDTDIRLTNTRTGNSKDFKFSHYKRNAEGEMYAWYYTCTTNPLALIIFND